MMITDGAIPVKSENGSMVNHWGTLISNEELELVPDKRLNNAYLNIDPEKDWNYEGVSRTLREYMEAHPPQKNKNREFER